MQNRKRECVCVCVCVCVCFMGEWCCVCVCVCVCGRMAHNWNTFSSNSITKSWFKTTILVLFCSIFQSHMSCFYLSEPYLSNICRYVKWEVAIFIEGKRGLCEGTWTQLELKCECCSSIRVATGGSHEICRGKKGRLLAKESIFIQLYLLNGKGERILQCLLWWNLITMLKRVPLPIPKILFFHSKIG